jgi:hypothetical protein
MEDISNLIEIVKLGKQNEYVFCRVCGRDVAEVNRALKLKRAKVALAEKGKKHPSEEELNEYIKSAYWSNVRGKDCWDCMHLGTAELKELIRILRRKLEAVEKVKK